MRESFGGLRLADPAAVLQSGRRIEHDLLARAQAGEHLASVAQRAAELHRALFDAIGRNSP